MTDLAAPPRSGPSRREHTKLANRQILEGAHEAFAELGYGAASVRDVIRRTDLAAGTFYNYFPDMESVFRALLDDSARRARTVVRESARWPVWASRWGCACSSATPPM